MTNTAYVSQNRRHSQNHNLINFFLTTNGEATTDCKDIVFRLEILLQSKMVI